MRAVPALVALLLVTAGCNGLGAPEDTSRTVAPDLQHTPTATADPTESPGSDASLPPGVTPDAEDEVDERALYLAHDEALRGRSVTWRDGEVRINDTGTVLGWSTRTVWIDGSSQRYEVETGGVDPAAVRIGGTAPEYWTNGNVTVSRFVRPNGSVTVRVREGGPTGSFANLGAGRVVLESTLTGTDLQYVGTERRNETDTHVLAGTANDSRLALRVTSEGVIRSLHAETDREVDGAEVTFVSRFRVFGVGSTAVERPAWAANATR